MGRDYAAEYIERLKKSGKERRRLTQQLRYLVGKVLDEIITNVPVWTKADVDDLTFTVQKITSNLGSEVYMTVKSRHFDRPSFVMDASKEPGAQWHLHGDLSLLLRNAPVDIWLKTANHLDEVIQAFQVPHNEAIDTLRKAFTTLRMLTVEGSDLDGGKAIQDLANKVSMIVDYNPGVGNPEVVTIAVNNIDGTEGVLRLTRQQAESLRQALIPIGRDPLKCPCSPCDPRRCDRVFDCEWLGLGDRLGVRLERPAPRK